MSQQLFNLNKETLDFSVPNPRFANIKHKANDVKLYGSSLERMRDSMIETYKSTRSLLLQPIVVEFKNKKYIVRAGYTRALAFVNYYDEIKEAIGLKDDVTIPAMLFDNISVSESLSENLVRNNQNFSSIAYAIKQAMAIKGNTVSKVAYQLGMNKERVSKLLKISGLKDKAIEFCIKGIINEDGAYELTNHTKENINLVCDSIQSKIDEAEEDGEEFDVVYDDRGIRTLISSMFRDISSKVPREAFIDLEGNEHPHITEEPWYVEISGGNMFNGYTKDAKATNKRSRLYWEKYANENGIEVKNRGDVNYWNMIRVEPGTYPEEIAIWDWSDNYFEFYVNQSIINKYNDIGKDKTDKYVEAVDRKIYSMKTKAREEAVVECVDQLLKSENINLDYAYMFFVRSLCYDLKKPELAMIGKIWNVEIEDRDDIMKHEADLKKILEVIVMAKILTCTWLPKELMHLFNENDININMLIERKQKEIDSMRSDMIAKAKEKGEDFAEHDSAILNFVKNYNLIYCVDSNCFLNGNLDQLGDDIVKTVCRKLGVKYKDNTPIVRKRIENFIKAFIDKVDFDENDIKIMDSQISIIIKNAKDSFDEMFATGQTDAEIIQNHMKNAARQLNVEGYANNDILFDIYDVKKIIKTDRQKDAYMKAFFMSFVEKSNTKLHLPITAIYLNDKNKARFIGEI